MSNIGLPDDLSRDDAYVRGVDDGEQHALATINQHIPSLSNDDDRELDERRYNSDVDRYGQPRFDNADLALRTCQCGAKLDGFYEYVDHLKEVLS